MFFTSLRPSAPTISIAPSVRSIRTRRPVGASGEPVGSRSTAKRSFVADRCVSASTFGRPPCPAGVRVATAPVSASTSASPTPVNAARSVAPTVGGAVPPSEPPLPPLHAARTSGARVAASTAKVWPGRVEWPVRVVRPIRMVRPVRIVREARRPAVGPVRAELGGMARGRGGRPGIRRTLARPRTGVSAPPAGRAPPSAGRRLLLLRLNLKKRARPARRRPRLRAPWARRRTPSASGRSRAVAARSRRTSGASAVPCGEVRSRAVRRRDGSATERCSSRPCRLAPPVRSVPPVPRRAPRAARRRVDRTERRREPLQPARRTPSCGFALDGDAASASSIRAQRPYRVACAVSTSPSSAHRRWLCLATGVHLAGC